MSDSRRVEWCAIQGSSSWDKKVDSVLRSKITFSELFPCGSRSSCDEPGNCIPNTSASGGVRKKESYSYMSEWRHDTTNSLGGIGYWEKRLLLVLFSFFFLMKGRSLATKKVIFLISARRAIRPCMKESKIKLYSNFALAAPYEQEQGEYVCQRYLVNASMKKYRSNSSTWFVDRQQPS